VLACGLISRFLKLYCPPVAAVQANVIDPVDKAGAGFIAHPIRKRRCLRARRKKIVSQVADEAESLRLWRPLEVLKRITGLHLYLL
jgi:hypothetical protein